VELVHVYSNLAVSGLALVELRAQAAATHRPAVQARARKSSGGSLPNKSASC
jgi:hypothetical protein